MSDQGSSGSERGGVLGRRRQKPQAPPPDPALDPGRDALTGLPTRGVLHEWLKQAVAASRPNSTRVILAFLDLDSLRDVNDSFGPDAGDFVLRSAGERLNSLGWQGTQVLRWGGAELAVVVPGVASVDAPDQIAKALLETIGAPYALGQPAGHDRLPRRPGHRQRRLRHRGRARARRPPGPGERPRGRPRRVRRARRDQARALLHPHRRGPAVLRPREPRVPAALAAHRAGRQPRAVRRRGAAALAGAGRHQHRRHVPARLPAPAREVRPHRAGRALGHRGDVSPGAGLVGDPSLRAVAVRHLQRRRPPAGHARLRRVGAPDPGRLGHAPRAPVPRHHRGGVALQRLVDLDGAAPAQGRRRQARARQLRHRHGVAGGDARHAPRPRAHRPASSCRSWP